MDFKCRIICSRSRDASLDGFNEDRSRTTTTSSSFARGSPAASTSTSTEEEEEEEEEEDIVIAVTSTLVVGEDGAAGRRLDVAAILACRLAHRNGESVEGIACG